MDGRCGTFEYVCGKEGGRRLNKSNGPVPEFVTVGDGRVSITIRGVRRRWVRVIGRYRCQGTRRLPDHVTRTGENSSRVKKRPTRKTRIRTLINLVNLNGATQSKSLTKIDLPDHRKVQIVNPIPFNNTTHHPKNKRKNSKKRGKSEDRKRKGKGRGDRSNPE